MNGFVKLLAVLAVLGVVVYMTRYEETPAPDATEEVVDDEYSRDWGEDASESPPLERMLVEKYAREARCTVVSYEGFGGGANVVLRARERNSLGEFLDVAVRMGRLKDIEMVTKLSMSEEKGVRYYSVSYTLYFNY